MDFYLQPAFLSPPPPLEITEERFLTLSNSRKILNAAFSLEENYDLLIGNYVELENSGLTISSSTMVRREHSYQDFFELTSEMNRRAVNFLSTARLFIDQIRQRVRACNGNSDEIKRHLSEEYDGSFEYRFMEALRNHVQHSGSAVHSLSLGGQRQRSSPHKQIFSLEVKTQKRFLVIDPTFKKTVLEECPDEVDFLSAARIYLGSLSKIHKLARENTAKSTEMARLSFEKAVSDYANFANATTLGLSAFSSIEKDNVVNILLNWDDVRLKLVERNRILENLSNCVVASTFIDA